ncbi:hypothetical protein TIFTF001_035732 [Ficus carica]|uniref:Uncharacterized protein n=1 Tax=Ficus carica TaxID=3494 RepID=A0AA88E3X7_FICCA|nr:hypothetical protein TIFTF001_035732 [Ficus carica]
MAETTIRKTSSSGYLFLNQQQYWGFTFHNFRSCITMFMKKNHAAGALGYGSVTMLDGSNPYVEELLSMDNSGTERMPDEVLTPTNCGRHAGNRRPADNAGPSRSKGSAGKRKQRDATDEMTYVAMQEIITHLRSRSQSGASNDQSSRTDHLLMCMNCMTEMGIPQYQRMIMWHYFDAHPQL